MQESNSNRLFPFQKMDGDVTVTKYVDGTYCFRLDKRIGNKCIFTNTFENVGADELVYTISAMRLIVFRDQVVDNTAGLLVTNDSGKTTIQYSFHKIVLQLGKPPLAYHINNGDLIEVRCVTMQGWYANDLGY